MLLLYARVSMSATSLGMVTLSHIDSKHDHAVVSYSMLNLRLYFAVCHVKQTSPTRLILQRYVQ